MPNEWFKEECGKIEDEILRRYRKKFDKLEGFLLTLEVDFNNFCFVMEYDHTLKRIELTIKKDEDELDSYLQILMSADVDSMEIVGIDAMDNNTTFLPTQTKQISEFLEDLRNR